ncbi:DegT/DnrJ/EryC1/StrS family aminotransferase [Natrarchaeobius sp. A-rgal3]|uniref:DegT/DnrJ/EryC1/StrS family aminotransferase n=1 Tax=Natrarchaeobius versutus TaxID=1679078 RepID=UPI00350EF3FD
MKGDTPARYGGEPVRSETIGYGRQSITDHEKAAVISALEGDYITRGPTVTEFEDKVAKRIGVDHAIATTSGTSALHLAGQAAGFSPGEEILTTPLTFVSTALTAVYTGATPVFADIDPHSRTLDPEAVRRQLTASSAGLVPMHYAGHPADIEGLLSLADEHDLTVIWDACHAFGGSWRDEPLGAQRDAAVFSFHPVKNITTGEGGMVVTNDGGFASRVRRLRSFDIEYEPDRHVDKPWYQVADGIGYNYNITDFQAALGLAQLERLEEFKRQRDKIIDRYDEAFGEIDGLRTPPTPVDSEPMYHLYVLEVSDEFGCSRKEFVHAMHAENIGVQVHYVPLHYHPLFQKKYDYSPGEFPVTERVYRKIVSLPLFPGMDVDDVRDVVRAVKRVNRYFSD